MLVNHFLQSIRKVYRRSDILLTDAGIQWLQRLPWPGNIRELRQLIERAVLLSSNNTLDVADIQQALEMQPGDAVKEKLPGIGHMTLEEMERSMIEKAMAYYNNNVASVAESLGISRAALYRRLEKFGIKL
jgi:DNA-binding NtrC family response regulator